MKCEDNMYVLHVDSLLTAGNHSVGSVWPAENITPLQHKLLQILQIWTLIIQDLNLLLLLLPLLLHWTTVVDGQAYQLQKSCET